MSRTVVAKHAIVTDTCRESKSSIGARDEALEKLREEYDSLLKHWTIGKGAKFHFVLSVEYE